MHDYKISLVCLKMFVSMIGVCFMFVYDKFPFQTYSDVDKKITCKQFLESYDSIQVVAQLIAFVQNIWSSSFCDSKFCETLDEGGLLQENLFIGCITGYNDTNGTIHYSLTDSTTQFIQKKIMFDACIFNATGVSFLFFVYSQFYICVEFEQRIVPIIPIDLNVTLNTNVCTICLVSYNDINDFFLQLTHGNQAGVCMDIVDTVRIEWRSLTHLLYFYFLKDELYSITVEQNL